MAVSGTLALTLGRIQGGRAGVTARRGTGTWGANWVFSASGAQEDIRLISEALVRTTGSGTFYAPTTIGGTIRQATIKNPTVSSGTFSNLMTVTAGKIAVTSGAVILGQHQAPLSGLYLKGAGGQSYLVTAKAYNGSTASGVLTLVQV